MVRVQPPLGWVGRTCSGRFIAAGGADFMGAALAARISRSCSLPVPSGGRRELAAGPARILGKLSSRRGGSASSVRGVDHRFRSLRMGGTKRTPPRGSRRPGFPPGLRRWRRSPADALAFIGQHKGGISGRVKSHAAGYSCRDGRVVSLARTKAHRALWANSRAGLARLFYSDWRYSLELPRGLTPPSTRA